MANSIAVPGALLVIRFPSTTTRSAVGAGVRSPLVLASATTTAPMARNWTSGSRTIRPIGAPRDAFLDNDSYDRYRKAIGTMDASTRERRSLDGLPLPFPMLQFRSSGP